MSELYWTHDKPTEEGWYWYIERAGVDMTLTSIVQVVDVTEDNNGSSKVVIVFKGDEEIYIEHMNGNWAGPLVPPSI